MLLLPRAGGVFRIDHDEKFNQTTHLQYQPLQRGPWIGFNWRYDSGLVAGPAPCAGGNCGNGPNGTDTIVDVSGLSPDQQFQAGLFCGTVHAAPPSAANPLGIPISSNGLCPGTALPIQPDQNPAPGTEDDDHNPPRIAPRHLFDVSVGHDNLFRGDKYKVELATHRHQRGQQLRPLQLHLNLQRNALRHAANAHRGDGFPFLDGQQVLAGP